MSDLLEKYNQWPDNKQSLIGVERVVFRIADSLYDDSNFCDEWIFMTDSEKAELLEKWRRIVTAEFVGTLEDAIK